MAHKLTTAEFKEKIFDFEAEKTWKYKGELPALVDFYAEWCGPCKMIAPVLDRIAEKYKDRIVVYKVDTDAEPALSGAFNVSSVPTLFFMPKSGEPRYALGALPEKELEKAINELLLAPAPVA